MPEEELRVESEILTPAAEPAENSTSRKLMPELFIGSISPLGASADALEDALKVVTERLNIDLCVISISKQLSRIGGLYKTRPRRDYDKDKGVSQEEIPYRMKMEDGDRFCELLGDDALVALAIKAIAEARSPNLSRQAYYIRSLKRPAEVDRLRKVYGNSSVFIAGHASRDYRIDRLSRKLTSANLKFDPDRARGPAENLLGSDEDEGTSFGQNVLHTYPKADFFVNVSGTRSAVVNELWRFISSLFGAHFQTPTPDEQGMALASLAAVRSAHPVRQVGASITTADGSVVAIGCNEVPRALGGLYWSDDKDDRRDFQLKEYESLALRQEVLADILKRLGDLGFLESGAKEKLEMDQDQFFVDLNSGKYKELRESRLMDALEYDRTVHAEMAAITDASRRGVSLKGCTLYCTTFPCHNCARHIVAAGIERVVYIQPFSKSLAKRLHGDAICVDAAPGAGAGRVRFDPFLGISPNLYMPLFTFRKRMGQGKDWKRFAKWSQKTSATILSSEVPAYLESERSAIRWLEAKMKEHGLFFRREAV